MKQKMKTAFELLTLLILVTLQISCSEDLEHTENIHSQKKINMEVKRITINDIQNNKNVIERINNASKVKSTSNRVINDTINNFYIDSEAGIIIEYNNYISYTFKVLRENGSDFLLENLVISKEGDNDYETYLYQYNINEQELILINQGVSIDLTNKITRITIENTNLLSDFLSRAEYNSLCEVVTTTYTPGQICTAGDNHTWEDILAGETCIGLGTTSGPLPGYYTTTTTIEPCNVGGGEDNSSGNDNNTGTSNESIGSSSGSVTTTPTTLSPEDWVKKSFKMELDEEQEVCFDDLSDQQEEALMDYVGSLAGDIMNTNVFDFANEALNAMCGNSNFNLDFEKSLKSPVFIDFSNIDTLTIEGQKLDCIYKKLMKSSTFKNLFEEMFGGNQTKLNVKFKIQNNLTNADGNSVNGSCTPTQITNGEYYNTITINGNILSGANQLSNILVAKTIIHEFLHAYLNIKYIDCNLGTPLPYLSNTELQNLMNSHFTAFCPINGGQNQHDFMFNEMIPVFQTIFSEIRDELLTQENINDYNVTEIIDANGIILEPFNWGNFYKYIAFDGLHQTSTFQSNINNPIELTKYNEYRLKAKNTNTNCQ